MIHPHLSPLPPGEGEGLFPGLGAPHPCPPADQPGQPCTLTPPRDETIDARHPVHDQDTSTRHPVEVIG